MGRRSERRSDRGSDHQRMMLAQEAARLISEHGIEDFRAAKSKAAENLGLRNHGALPNNREIETALAERNRLFGGARHLNMLDDMRTVALTVMYELNGFAPCLVGPVLSGNVTEHSAINLHLFTDVAEAVGMQLTASGFRHTTFQRRLRPSRDRTQDFPGYRFFVEAFEVETTVFPERIKAHAPLSPVDGRPMRRAKLRDVEALAFA